MLCLQLHQTAAGAIAIDHQPPSHSSLLLLPAPCLLLLLLLLLLLPKHRPSCGDV
jgi:hypothetical protein